MHISAERGWLHDWLVRPLDIIAAVILLLLMVLTCADVAGRYLFNAPINGATELTQLMMAGIVFAALPVVGWREDHVTVDLLDPVFPRLLVGLRQVLVSLLSATVLAVICWRVWLLAGRHAQYGDTTEYLQIPVAPVVYFIALMCAAASLLVAINAFCYLTGRGHGTR